jgi:hypothetical protein
MLMMERGEEEPEKRTREDFNWETAAAREAKQCAEGTQS